MRGRDYRPCGCLSNWNTATLPKAATARPASGGITSIVGSAGAVMESELMDLRLAHGLDRPDDVVLRHGISCQCAELRGFGFPLSLGSGGSA
jgi:hypothetical protein